MAAGIALREGAVRIEDEHLLLVMCYEPLARQPHLLGTFGIDPDEVVAGLRRHGIPVPEIAPLAAGEPPEVGPAVYFPRGQFDAVIGALAERHPPGSRWWWFNVSESDADWYYVVAEPDIPLQDIVRSAVADPGTIRIGPGGGAEETRRDPPATGD